MPSDLGELEFTTDQIRKLWDRHREPHGMDIQGLTEALNFDLRERLANLESCEDGETGDIYKHVPWQRAKRRNKKSVAIRKLEGA